MANAADRADKLIDVVIVNYNAGPILTECVHSVLRSSVPVRVFVSDNGSADGSVEYLRATLDEHPFLTIVENHANLGFARGNNVVLPRCRGEFVLFLNPDCIIQPDTLERMRAAMEAYPLAGMAGCLVRNPDGTEQAGCRRFVPTPWRALVRVFRLARIFRNHPRFSSFILTGQPLPAHPTPVEAISGAFMFVRRSAMDYVGTMDEGYFLHCEDLDWCMRFRQAGFTILFVPGVEIVHAKGVGSAAHPIRVEWHKHKGMIRFYRKFFRRNYPTLLLFMVIAAVWVRFAALAATLAVRNLFPAATKEAARTVLPQPPPAADERPLSPPAVIVTGATSQVGCFLIPRLREAGYVVHAISRRPADVSLVTDDSLIWHELDIVRDRNALKRIAGATVLIHLAPLGTLPQLIDVAAHMGIQRLVAFGSTSRYGKLNSTDPKEQQWVRELIDSEDLLARKCAERGVTWTLFRPTLIYGYGIDKNVTTIARFICLFGFFPILGEGKGLRRPVHADDLAAACLAVLACPASCNRAYNLSGGETLTYRQMVEAIFEGLGKRPRIIKIPLALFSVLLKVASLFPAYRHLNLEMVNRINLDLDFDHLAATRDFSYSPRKFKFSRNVGRHQNARRYPAAASNR
ncbi:MAG: glycosyltransferase [Betaproteobacteria bacterium]|nr:glycosyltransferase [Betaproteobacteria bacterium]